MAVRPPKPYRKYPPELPSFRWLRWFVVAVVLVLVLDIAGQMWR